MDFLASLHSTFKGLEPVFLFITNLGSENFYAILLTTYFWLVDPHFGRRLGMAAAASFLINDFLKLSFNTQRPFEIDPSIASKKAQETGTGPSFPSGHAQSSTITWMLIAMKQNKRWLWILSIALIALISFSRLALGVHFPIDVLGGIVIGLILALVAFLWPKIEMFPLAIRSGSLLFALAIAAVAPEYGRSLGVLCGFFLTTPKFDPPTTWQKRIIFLISGLIIVAAIYLGTGQAFRSFGKTGIGSFVRYLLITLAGTELAPRVFNRFFK